MDTPTNSKRYNCVLASWAKQGCDAKPECEECARDLTGHDVIENVGQLDCAAGWVCVACERKTLIEQDEGERAPSSRSKDLRYVGGGYAVDSSGNYREAFWVGTP